MQGLPAMKAKPRVTVDRNLQRWVLLCLLLLLTTVAQSQQAFAETCADAKKNLSKYAQGHMQAAFAEGAGGCSWSRKD